VRGDPVPPPWRRSCSSPPARRARAGRCRNPPAPRSAGRQSSQGSTRGMPSSAWIVSRISPTRSLRPAAICGVAPQTKRIFQPWPTLEAERPRPLSRRCRRRSQAAHTPPSGPPVAAGSRHCRGGPSSTRIRECSRDSRDSRDRRSFANLARRVPVAVEQGCTLGVIDVRVAVKGLGKVHERIGGLRAFKVQNP